MALSMASSCLSTAFRTLTLTRSIHSTPALGASPIKRKKKVDPMILRMREERRRKRLHKALRKMEKRPRIVIPVLELEVEGELRRQASKERARPVEVAPEVKEERALLSKEWNRYAGARHVKEVQQFDSVILSRFKALEELRMENFDLYAAAILPDDSLLPFRMPGPTLTPGGDEKPLPKQHIVDGHYEEVTKTYQIQYTDTKAFLQQLTMKEHRRKRSKNVDAADDD